MYVVIFFSASKDFAYARHQVIFVLNRVRHLCIMCYLRLLTHFIQLGTPVYVSEGHLNVLRWKVNIYVTRASTPVSSRTALEVR
jgi:hypothetical protein